MEQTEIMKCRVAIVRARSMLALLDIREKLWRLSIPANIEKDPDIVITDALIAGDKLATEVASLQEKLAQATDIIGELAQEGNYHPDNVPITFHAYFHGVTTPWAFAVQGLLKLGISK